MSNPFTAPYANRAAITPIPGLIDQQTATAAIATIIQAATFTAQFSIFQRS